MNMTLLMIGSTEIIIILLIVVLIFGGKKIPELARGLGKGIKEFRDASKGLSVDDSKEK